MPVAWKINFTRNRPGKFTLKIKTILTKRFFFQKEHIFVRQTLSQNDPNQNERRHQFTQNTPTNTPTNITRQQITKRLHTDNFTQNNNQQVNYVDILWVMDNSGSMGRIQRSSGKEFKSLAEKIVATGIGFNMEIITTGDGITFTPPSLLMSDCHLAPAGLPNILGHAPRSGGTLTSAKAQQDYNSFKLDFAEKISVGICGSGTERGILMSNLFFTNNPNWTNRTDLLVIIFISDEEEQSNIVVSDFVGQIQLLKDNSSRVKMFSIVNNTGSRYKEASRLTSGEVASITGGFSNIFTNFGTIIRGLLSGFALNQPQTEVDENTINITVNGGSWGVKGSKWNYDRTINSILFTQGNLPPGGARIQVTYNNKLKTSFSGFSIPQASINTIKVFVNGHRKTNWRYQNGTLTFTSPPPSNATIKLTYYTTGNHLKSTFPLTSPVHQDKIDTIEVSVDGSIIGDNLWNYTRGAIVFQNNYAPPAGSSVLVTHEEADDLLQSFPLKQELQDKIEANIANSSVEIKVENVVIPPEKWEYRNGKLVFRSDAIPPPGNDIVITHTENKELDSSFDMGLTDPTLTPVEVKVNQVRVSNSDWEYRDGKIHFPTNKIPPSGAKIVVTYRTLAKMRRIFQLRNYPHPDEVEKMQVLVNGKVLAKETGWEYREETNSIHFKEGHIPRRESVIEIAFTL